MQTMQALQWQNNNLELREVPLPKSNDGELLIKVLKAGICNTDLEIIRGYYPFQGTLGHEFVGQVAESMDHPLAGKRVVSDINCGCGYCSMCTEGSPHHCLNRKTLGINHKDGAFAEFTVLPAANLVAVPDQVSDVQASFAEPLAAALEIQEQVDMSDIDRVAVLGDGKLGLLIAMSLAAKGVEVNLIGRHPERLKLLGRKKILFHKAIPEDIFPLVVEATGSPRGFTAALKITTDPGGIFSAVGSFDFNPAPLVVNEITLLGSRCGPMEKSIQLMAEGLVDPAPLVSQVYPLTEGIHAVKEAARKGTLKILLDPVSSANV